MHRSSGSFEGNRLLYRVQSRKIFEEEKIKKEDEEVYKHTVFLNECLRMINYDRSSSKSSAILLSDTNEVLRK